VAPKNKAPKPRSTHVRCVLGLRVGGGTFRAVFTPDRMAGGYWVKVPELPGCLTEGDTLEEAKGMAREAIALWLKVTASQRRTRPGL
jgi:predicted RNase H-like HicB family nuclease